MSLGGAGWGGAGRGRAPRRQRRQVFRDHSVTVEQYAAGAETPMCICRDSYLMEDWLHFVDTFADYIFKDVLSQLLRRMWDLLSTSIRHYFRPRHFDSRSAFLTAAKEAHDALLEFATLAEQNDFPSCTFTSNLHMCICRCVLLHHVVVSCIMLRCFASQSVANTFLFIWPGAGVSIFRPGFTNKKRRGERWLTTLSSWWSGSCSSSSV